MSVKLVSVKSKVTTVVGGGSFLKAAVLPNGRVTCAREENNVVGSKIFERMFSAFRYTIVHLYFARSDIKDGQDYKYKITAAYVNYIWDKSHLKGVTYPSVQSEYLGQNVALLPELVNSSLQLEAPVGIFKFERKGGVNLPVDSTKVAMDLGKDNAAFVFKDYYDGAFR